MVNRTINIDVYDLTEARAEAAVAILREMIATGSGNSEAMTALKDALTICQSASLSFAEPVHVGTEKFVPLHDVTKENAEACGDCRVPRCQFCDAPGRVVGGLKNPSGKTYEKYYVCDTQNCIAHKAGTPMPLRLFAGGK